MAVLYGVPGRPLPVSPGLGAVRGSKSFGQGHFPRSPFNILIFLLLTVRTVEGAGGPDRYVASAADLRNGLHGQIGNKARTARNAWVADYSCGRPDRTIGRAGKEKE